jgi:hypothetical protein
MIRYTVTYIFIIYSNDFKINYKIKQVQSKIYHCHGEHANPNSYVRSICYVLIRKKKRNEIRRTMIQQAPKKVIAHGHG